MEWLEKGLYCNDNMQSLYSQINNKVLIFERAFDSWRGYTRKECLVTNSLQNHVEIQRNWGIELEVNLGLARGWQQTWDCFRRLRANRVMLKAGHWWTAPETGNDWHGNLTEWWQQWLTECWRDDTQASPQRSNWWASLSAISWWWPQIQLKSSVTQQ